MRVVEVDAALAQVLVEQLEHPLQQRQRRAQLVRGGGDERAARLLLAAEARPASTPSARARSPTSSRASSRGGGACEPVGGDPQRGLAQALEAARSASRDEPGAEHERDDEADERGGEERRADLGDGLADVGQRLARLEDAGEPAARGRAAASSRVTSSGVTRAHACRSSSAVGDVERQARASPVSLS